MADVTITAANVVEAASAEVVAAVWGETITAGQSVYRKSSDQRFWKAQCDGTAEESGVGVQFGVAITGGSAGQRGTVQTGGTVTIGGTVTACVEYVVSNTAGGIMPKTDLSTSTWKYTSLGYATTSAILYLRPHASGVAVP